MQKTFSKKILSRILCMVLIVAMALCTTACADSSDMQSNAGSKGEVESSVLGKGDTVFTFSVVDKEGNETRFEIHTDKTVVGDALLELGLIEGEKSDYGLYIKKVNGITADYDVDGTYWAFFVNGDYAVSGVDTTEIVEGDSYSFEVK